MAVVQGVKEKVHLPLYDSIKVESEKQLRAVENSSILRFFTDVQGKTKLETNMQAASVLSHYNTFEARAMRVVISDLPPEFPDDSTVSSDDVDLDLFVSDADDNTILIDSLGRIRIVNSLGLTVREQPNFGVTPTPAPTLPFTIGTVSSATIELGLFSLVELLKEAEESEDGFVEIPLDDEAVISVKKTVTTGTTTSEVDLTDAEITNVAEHGGGVIFLDAFGIETMIDELDREAPPSEQIFPNNGSGTLIGKLIYNTVTTFFVGEKAMIQMPTWFFPSGAGPFSGTATVTTNGEPSPMDTFRFAEPIFIDKQQNFRVEIEIPDADVLKDIQSSYGPLFIWVVLDGYTTRDVQ